MDDPYDELDDWDEDEGEDEDSGETVVVPCPSCGAKVFEDAERCPSCGDYIVHRHGAWEGKPRWWIGLGLLGILAVVWLLLMA